jgi:hypothetical protein
MSPAEPAQRSLKGALHFPALASLRHFLALEECQLLRKPFAHLFRQQAGGAFLFFRQLVDPAFQGYSCLSAAGSACLRDILGMVIGAPVSRGLKNLAKELDIPVITVSQLNREVEKRSGNRKPQLSDLRESGSIENDADLVLLISRENMDARIGEEGRTAEIAIGKQRNGMTGTFKLTFRKEITRFENYRNEID